jgi:hypothetical protein
MEITVDSIRDGEAIWLHVEDDGIGMSERTITTSLLDFGKSFWEQRRGYARIPRLARQRFVGDWSVWRRFLLRLYVG